MTARQIGSSIGIALLGSLALTGLTAALPSVLASLHLPPAVQARPAHEATAASSSGSIGRVPGVKPSPALTHAIGVAFVSGQSEAYLVAAALMVVCTALGAVLMRGRQDGSAVTPTSGSGESSGSREPPGNRHHGR